MLPYAFGDTHGCYDLVMDLVGRLRLIQAGRDHRRFWLGDYIDRGSHSAHLVTYLIESKASRPEDVFLVGNHEDMLLANFDDFDSPYPES
jgi:serine/threonine protein phosphatase 1